MENQYILNNVNLSFTKCFGAKVKYGWMGQEVMLSEEYQTQTGRASRSLLHRIYTQAGQGEWDVREVCPGRKKHEAMKRGVG